MQYVEVLVADNTFHGKESLTYSTEQDIPIGAVVTVSLRRKQVLGIVIRLSTKPKFVVKPITNILPVPNLPVALVKVLLWMASYYPSPYGVLTQLFLPKKITSKSLEQHPLKAGRPKANLPQLTDEQQKILKSVNDPGTYLLHGDTGTGKTRIYIELARRSLDQGKSAIILTPEIGLTSQLAESFKAVFGNAVVVVHSQLTESVRNRLWVELARRENPVVIVGPRSALFSPIGNLGLIVIDEEHETAYKQDQAPYYHASRVASKLAQQHNAVLMLGSATPLVTDYYMATSKHRPILRMEQLATGGKFEQNLSVVDLLDRKEFSRKPYISNTLIAAMEKHLRGGEQILLFLNRRGTARLVFCDECGWQALCPRCDIALVYHGDQHKMRCHICQFVTPSPSSCPICHNTSVVFRSIGTKAIVDDITDIFPDAKIIRFDTDNKKSETLEQNYKLVHDKGVDIIIGTQTLAKGLDLPGLGLVGVIVADTGLYFPDYSAQERTYQLLSQVLGRVARGHRASEAIIQTYTPDSPLLQSVIAKKWQLFYETELRERQKFMFPPYCHLLKLVCRRASQESAAQTAEKLVEKLASSGLHIVVEGPAPAFHAKIMDKYQWQVVVKSKNRDELLKVIDNLPSGWSYDIDPMDLL